jgi:hypothetical protein
MHAQMVAYDVTENNGVNVGINPEQLAQVCTTPPCQLRTYRWYAGDVVTNPDGTTTGVPLELGAANLIASDPFEQQPLAMIGALVVEPAGSKWPPNGGTSADIVDARGSLLFREFVGILQNNVYLTSGVFNSINFGVEPMSYRFGASDFEDLDISKAFSNQMTNPSSGKPQGDPQTPIFCALAGSPVRFRLLHPDGLGGFPDDVWTINGHAWPEEPFVSAGGVPSSVMGPNPNSQWFGARDGFGAGNHFDILLSSAGGQNKVAGDYLYKSFPAAELTAGNWGVFRVNKTPQEQAACVSAVEPRLLNVVPGVKPLSVTPPRPVHKDPEERFENRKTQKEKGEKEEPAGNPPK